MSAQEPSFSQIFPFLSIRPASTSGVTLKRILKHWPEDKQQILDDAQRARDILVNHCSHHASHQDLLNDVRRYLPFALAIQNEKRSNPSIKISGLKFHWIQSNVVASDFKRRSFDGNSFGLEIAHLYFFEAILLLDESHSLCLSQTYGPAIAYQREAAGIFDFLASNHSFVEDDDPLPVELETSFLLSLKMFSLSQCHAMIALSKQPLNPKTLWLLYHYIGSQLIASHDTLIATPLHDRKVAYHRKYESWLRTSSELFFAGSLYYGALFFKSKDELGNALSLIRISKNKLGDLIRVSDIHTKIKEPSQKMLEAIIPIEKEWIDENVKICGDRVPPPLEAEELITSFLNQLSKTVGPIPFTPPEMFVPGVSQNPFS